MRAGLPLLAALTAGLALVVPSDAQQFTTAQTSAVGMGGKPGNFVSGFTPVNLMNKPMDVSGAMRPGSVQATMMPQQRAPRVFNLNSAFRSFDMPLFRSTKPNVPIVQPGPDNPIQPVAIPKMKPAPQNSLPKFGGLLPGLGG